MTLAAQVPDGGTVLIDTNPSIFVLEGNPLGAPFRSIFEAVDNGRIRALVTPITVAEVVTGPLKANRDALAERYRRTITHNPVVRFATSTLISRCSLPACGCVTH